MKYFMDEHLKTIISEYALKRVDKTITQEEFEKFNAILKSDSESARFYNELMMTFLNFEEFGEKIAASENASQYPLDEETLQILAQTEKVAPEVVVEDTGTVIVESAKNEPISKKPNKFFRIYNILVSAAAVLFFMFILYAHVFPPHYSVQVASVVDQVEVQWNSASEKLGIDDRVLTNQPPYILDKGIVKLLYDEGVDVLIEGPAEFQVLAKDRVGLKYGKVYSIVSNGGLGFSVYTDNAKVIDLGTEFGVLVDSNGDTDIHVVKGKTMLIAGGESDTVSMEIQKGRARKVSANSRSIVDIDCKDKLFVRKINSENNFVWRGHDSISLADIVGGGSGFGSGRLDSGINIKSGKVVNDLPGSGLDYGIEGFLPVVKLKYVDGVFSPGITKGDFITADQTYSYKFPETAGFYWGYIFNGAYHVGYEVPKHYLELNGITFGSKENPAISMHPNLGITFDLEAIRTDYPDLRLVNFKSLIGISQTVRQYAENNNNIDEIYQGGKINSAVEFWVIIDGNEAVRQKLTDVEDAVQIVVPIEQDSKYLTLATTEVNNTISYSWALFGNPELTIEFSK